jgi:hypothetical protein
MIAQTKCVVTTKRGKMKRSEFISENHCVKLINFSFRVESYCKLFFSFDFEYLFREKFYSKMT